MDLKIAPNDAQSMSQDGDAILRSLQNKSLPMIDLMVRESLQNSLDATLPKAKITKVNFKINTFQSEELAFHLESLEDSLLEKYPGEQTMIAICDKNTWGLTGDYKANDAKTLEDSNFQKLVFGIGKNQDQEGSGGSWGLGKTSYFRIGAGIVIYYTRVAIGDVFEERLIASLIESPKQSERLLKESERGIAWWGEFDSTKTKIYPIINKHKIKEILQIFGLKNYEGNETGTTILIPYVKPIVETEDLYPWELDIKESIIMAVQRWYSPRILNDKYSEETENSFLECKVNDLAIHPLINMEPTFTLFRELYTSALLGQPQMSNIKVEAINLRGNAMLNVNEPVGHIAFCEVSREAMQMNTPNNKFSALAYLGVKDKTKIDKNISKVIAYARKPGMIVEYSIDGEWAPRGLIQNDDHLLFGFFVPNSKGMLLPKFKEKGYPNLESYLRATENADHAKWEDEVGIGIIRRIKTYSADAIKKTFEDLIDNGHTTATSALSRKFGALLMPPKNFGKTSTKKKEKNVSKRMVSSRNRVSDITIIDSIPINESYVKVLFKGFIKRESKNTIFVQILTQDQKINEESWIKIMGNNITFPFVIESLFLKNINNEKISTNIENNNCYKNDDIKISLQANQLVVESKSIASLEIEGEILLAIYSNQYIPSIVIRSEMGEKEGGN